MHSLKNCSVRARLTLCLIAVTTALCGAPVQAQDDAVPLPRLDTYDSRNFAVVCAWQIYVLASTMSTACGRQRQPVDDAIDRAIAEIDDYILANSSGNETRETLKKTKRLIVRKVREFLTDPTKVPFVCGPQSISDALRFVSPDRITQSQEQLFSLPRDRTAAPCL